MKPTIKEIKHRFQSGEITESELEAFRLDERKGVKHIVAQHDRKMEEKKRLKERFEEMLSFENYYKEKGKRCIAGIDEAGRGPLAGPVVAGAVILPDDFFLEGLYDSKQLSVHKREEYYEYIQENADVGVGMVTSEEIDHLNIYRATKLAMQRAVDQLSEKPDQLLIDAMKVEAISCEQESIVKGDQRSVSIAAASIMAKVSRDRFMKELSWEYPSYDFDLNQGYGTKNHLDALKTHGVTPHHRKSFAPVKERILL
ncbi:ribonuclease HII [Halobacillus andaensis]|uniref:Ribonuclease HII n=1 Tax=Halobacillus andaensis TaxID=1176239 RepID=A0A917B117_HALAA|nr:ribonuclease HII [Halobacillus andaensis]MBP2003511.1 ribonuclease HII [Halobacillus andaensis]GGF11175.1 ribonuclease HII [Halobacillus andaensis]